MFRLIYTYTFEWPKIRASAASVGPWSHEDLYYANLSALQAGGEHSLETLEYFGPTYWIGSGK